MPHHKEQEDSQLTPVIGEFGMKSLHPEFLHQVEQFIDVVEVHLHFRVPLLQSHCRRSSHRLVRGWGAAIGERRDGRRWRIAGFRVTEVTGLLGGKRKRLPTFLLIAFIYAGNDLLSHTLSRAVQSALRGLTSVFGMGTGGSPAV